MLVVVHLSSILFVLLNLFVKDSSSEIRLKSTDLTRISRLTSLSLVVEAYYVLEVFFCNRYIWCGHGERDLTRLARFLFVFIFCSTFSHESSELQLSNSVHYFLFQYHVSQ